jgi:hypothetical protein
MAKAAATKRVSTGRGHYYKLDGKTAKGRGVTTLIGNAMPKGGLTTWAANSAAACAVDERDIWEPLAEQSRDAAYDYLRNAHTRDRDKAAGRGTEVHRLAEKLAAGQEVDVPDELLGHVDAYLEFREMWQPTDEIIEGVVINRTQNYLGTFDSIATLPGWNPDASPARILYDIKTNRSGVYPETVLQLAAYRYAETFLPDPDGGDELPMPEVDGCAVLHIRTDGFSLIPVEAGPRAFRQFLYEVQTAEFIGSGWKEEDKGWGHKAIGTAIAAPNEPF